MKKSALLALALLTFNCAFAQITKDTVKLDSTNVERIKKMPMDTTQSKMPVAPLPVDSVKPRNSGDDADPGRPRKKK